MNEETQEEGEEEEGSGKEADIDVGVRSDKSFFSHPSLVVEIFQIIHFPE